MIRYLLLFVALGLFVANTCIGSSTAPSMSKAELEQQAEAAFQAQQLQSCEQCDAIDDGPREANLLARKGCKAWYCTPPRTAADHEKMIALLEEAARLGSPEANFFLGWAYYETDKDRATHYFENAAVLGHAGAQTKLATILNAKQDPAAAQYWFEKAVAQNDSHAMAFYGMYLYFMACKKSPHTKKGRWFDLILHAAREGDRMAQHFMLILPQYFAEELPWFREQAVAGAEQYYCMAGEMHELGVGAPQNLHIAREWYEKALRCGITSGVANLFMLLDH